MKKKPPFCPLAKTMECIGGKWKPLLLFHLIDGKKRSGELQQCVRGISNKVFTEALREMERSGLVVRTVYPVVPPKVEYALSALGESLIPILKSLDDWGRQFEKEA